jgi:hypothetical protein
VAVTLWLCCDLFLQSYHHFNTAASLFLYDTKRNNCMAIQPRETVAGNIVLPRRGPPQAGSKPSVTCQAKVRRRTAASTASTVPARSTRYVAEGPFYCCDEVRLCLCGTGPLTGPLSIPQMIHGWIQNSGGMILTGKTEGLGEKICPTASLSTTNPTWTDLDANKGLRGEKPATNRLSYGTAQQRALLWLLKQTGVTHWL